MSMADAQLVMELRRRLEVLEALIEGDPLIERVQRLEMRCGSLQSQLILLRNKASVAPTNIGDGLTRTTGAADKADAAAR